MHKRGIYIILYLSKEELRTIREATANKMTKNGNE